MPYTMTRRTPSIGDVRRAGFTRSIFNSRRYGMARLPCIVVPGQPQHLIQRGNNRGITFVADEDYQFYLEKLTEASQRFTCD